MTLYAKTGKKNPRKYFSISMQATFALFYFTVKDYAKKLTPQFEGAYEYEIAFLCFHICWGQMIDIQKMAIGSQEIKTK